MLEECIRSFRITEYFYHNGGGTKMKRKWFLTMMALILALAMLPVYGAGAESEKPLKFGFSLSNQKQDRWILEEQLMKEFCDSKGIEFICLVADDDTERQYAQVESMISNGVNAVFVRPVDSASAGTIAQMVHDAGALYIAYDVLTLNGPVDYYITFDSELVGREQAQALVDVAPTGNYVLINGNPPSNNAQLYYKGAMEVLQPLVDSGDINIVADQWCAGFNADLASQHIENALTANNNDIQAVLACTDSLATPIVAALEAQGLAGIVPVCGQDAELAACQRIVEGTQTMTVYKPVRRLNKAAMDIVYADLTGADVESAPVEGTWGSYDNGNGDVKAYKIEIITVTKDNMMDTVIAEGYQQKDAVYANIPESERPAD